jgi:uncharacterized membrane protein
MGMSLFFEALALMLATALAVWLRPWRGLSAQSLPWPWVVAVALMPFLWALDGLTGVTLSPRLSGAALLVLLAGWPLTVLTLLPVAFVAALVGPLDWAEAVHRGVWFGLLPASLMLVLGAAVRRWLPRHPATYMLGRGCVVVFATCAVAALSFTWLRREAGVAVDASMVAALLGAWGETVITAWVVALGVACHPHWLATYSDRLYWPDAARG